MRYELGKGLSFEAVVAIIEGAYKESHRQAIEASALVVKARADANEYDAGTEWYRRGMEKANDLSIASAKFMEREATLAKLLRHISDEAFNLHMSRLRMSAMEEDE